MTLQLVRHAAALVPSRLLLAGVFLLSARTKVRNARGFVRLVIAYRILPLSLARLYGRLLPWLEAVLGLWLLLGVAFRYAGALTGLLLTSFFVAVAVNLLRGRRQLACGCFGGSDTLGAATLVREVALLLPALHLALATPAPPEDPLARLASSLAWHPAPLDWPALALSLAGLAALRSLARTLVSARIIGRPITATHLRETHS
ncbi:MAG: MauE/DoxX family redox-associated membrane protein [Thiobacillaceae bacterium]